MPTFTEIKERFKIEKLMEILNDIFIKGSIENEIVRMITRRLYISGIDANYQKLHTDKGQPFYSPYTQMEKLDKGQKITNVTLNDTGEFYNSFEVEAKKVYFEIKANFGTIYENFIESYPDQITFIKAIAALTEGELNELLQVIKPKIIEQLKNL